MTTIYLALGGSLKNIETGFCKPPPAAVLCSYVYFETFEPLLMRGPHVREWVLDSGAFSAFMSKTSIHLDDYIDFCLAVKDSARPPTEVYALDVIGDWKASLKNTEAMWRAGVEAIPCYHVGEPEDVLKGLARDYPKIAIGGAAGRLFGDQRGKFLAQCFARIWPKKVHGFGVTDTKILRAIPFHSVDATSWQLGALRFGTWAAYNLPVPGTRKNHYLRPEVQVFLDLEAQLKARWSKEMKELECNSTAQAS